MVTHNWDNLFSHLVAATLASAMGYVTYEHVLRILAKPHGVQESVEFKGFDRFLMVFLGFSHAFRGFSSSGAGF